MWDSTNCIGIGEIEIRNINKDPDIKVYEHKTN